MILEQIQSPADVKRLSDSECRVLCGELREFLIDHVSATGGHLASNLGVVELTVAIHRVFDTASDRLVFDVGHQCYVHKLLTGRRDRFDTLRQYRGLSGFPKPYESVHDAFIAGHASNSVSVALGMARARTLQHADYSVLALIGDGALTGGLAYEGLNDAGDSGEPLILILNDNGMSINGNVGGMSAHLKTLRTKPGYYSFKKWYRGLFGNDINTISGNPLYRFNHRIKTEMKRTFFPSSTLFEDMGFTYLGPVDGHNLEQLTTTLRWAKELRTPVVVHVNTVKGRGYTFAEQEPDLYHGVGPFDPKYGVPRAEGRDFSAAFGAALTSLAEEDGRICAITAAMKEGTGLSAFAEHFPERFFDVGIAEGHGVSMAGGLAKQGMIPVMAVYSSFLQRGFDELLHDIALDGLHAVFAVDRAGFVGNDGETHHGVFDVGFLSAIPGMTVFAPSNYAELREMLRTAAFSTPGPVAIRYPRGCEGAYRARSGAADSVFLRTGGTDVLLCYGTMVNSALDAAERLEKRGVSLSVLKLNRIMPLDTDVLPAQLAGYRRIFVAEETEQQGGAGERLALLLSAHACGPERIRLRNLGARFVAQGSTEELRRELGLDAESLADWVAEERAHEQ